MTIGTQMTRIDWIFTDNFFNLADSLHGKLAHETMKD